MSLSSLSIRRPVLAIVMSVVIVLFGVISYTFLGVREYPAVDPPVISVQTNYRGANADVIESQITEPLEESINGVEGIRTLTSSSSEGRSNITVEFQLGVDLERAANDVRDRVSRAMNQLPPDVDPPTVSKADADSQPILGLAVSSDTRDLLDLTRMAEENIGERLQTIPGVAGINVWGAKTYAMRIWLDPHRLAAYQLSPLDVRTALSRENVELPSGRIEGQSVELTVRTMSRLETPQDFNDLILKEEGGQIVRLRDIGRAELGPENERTGLKTDGIPMVFVVVVPQPGANHVSISDEVQRRMVQLRRDVPADIRIEMGFDSTQFIRKSILEVVETIFIAMVLVILIIFAFLRDWRSTLIPVLAIPVSLIGVFFIMYLMDFSINVLTLLGIVLAIGIVVDDAIVVLENIYTKIEDGMSPIRAGIEGTQEIFFAVVATTLALAAVFLPILFQGGLTGALFREFGVVIAGSVLISAFVALSLTPMLSSRLLKAHEHHSWFYRKTEPFFEGMTRTYANSLAAFMRHRWLALPVVLAAFGLIHVLWSALPHELAPMEDRGEIRLNATGPEGATFEYMDVIINQLAALAEEEAGAETASMLSITSPGFFGATNSGFVRLRLTDAETRDRSQDEIANALTAKVNQITGARIFVSQPPTISTSRRGSNSVDFVLQAPNFEKLKEVLPAFLERAQDDPTFTFVDANLKFSKPELRLTINRERARDLGVSALDIAQTLQLAYSAQRIGYFIMDGKQYQVIAQVERQDRDETADLKSIFVRNASGQPVQLDNLVQIAEESSPPQLYRFDRYVAATVSAGLTPGKTMGDGIEAMEAIAADVLDESFATALSGTARDFQESASSLVFIFGLAVVLIYLILAGQFESFRDPMTIIMTVPLAAAGALLTLWYFNQTVNIFSQIGLTMLIGLVTKNGILIVEFANQRRQAGLSIREAVEDAAVARLRPVLMTSLATVLGILPIALALGAGAESRKPMGIAVIGGLLIGTFLTLYVIPAIYTFLARRTLPPSLDEPVDAEAPAARAEVLEPVA